MIRHIQGLQDPLHDPARHAEERPDVQEHEHPRPGRCAPRQVWNPEGAGRSWREGQGAWRQGARWGQGGRQGRR